MLSAMLLFAQQNTAASGDVVIEAGEVKVTRAELDAAIETLPEEYRSYASGPGRKAFGEDYLRMRLLAAEAERAGLADKPEVRERLKLMRENTLANAQIERMREGITVSDADLQKEYEGKKAELEQAKARHILIAPEGSPAAPPAEEGMTDDEARQKAEEIRQKLIAGADFAELASSESHDRGSAARGGDLGSFTRGRMVPEFEQAVFNGTVGEIQPLVKTQFGYHVIQVQERGVVPLAEVREELEEQIVQEKLQAKLEALQGNFKPKFDESYFGAGTPTAEVQPGSSEE